MKKTVFANTAVVALLCVPFWGQTSAPPANTQNAELEQHIRELEDRVIALEGKIRTMESEKAASAQPQPAQPGTQPEAGAAAQTTVPSPSATVPSPAVANETQAGLANAGGQLQVYGGSGGASAAKALNPDISVIGDFVGAVGGNTAPPLATLQPF